MPLSSVTELLHTYRTTRHPSTAYPLGRWTSNSVISSGARPFFRKAERSERSSSTAAAAGRPKPSRSVSTNLASPNGEPASLHTVVHPRGSVVRVVSIARAARLRTRTACVSLHEAARAAKRSTAENAPPEAQPALRGLAFRCQPERATLFWVGFSGEAEERPPQRDEEGSELVRPFRRPRRSALGSSSPSPAYAGHSVQVWRERLQRSSGSQRCRAEFFGAGASALVRSTWTNRSTSRRCDS